MTTPQIIETAMRVRTAQGLKITIHYHRAATRPDGAPDNFTAYPATQSQLDAWARKAAQHGYPYTIG